MEISKKLKDYSMAEIARIIEANNAKVISSVIERVMGDTVLIKIRISDGEHLRGAVDELMRYGYKIENCSLTTNMLEEVKDRYSQLMKYLDI